MKRIGGYFELELTKGEHYHKEALRFNTATNCFESILRSRHYEKVYIPYYTCDVLLNPIYKLGLNFEFYNINKSLEPINLPKLKNKEAFLYTNYFGLKQECVKRLVSKYGNQLIVDNAQAFYAEPLEEIDTFYSARKFFGVPDGAYLYTDKPLHQDFGQDYSYERVSHLLKRIDLGAEEGYQDFRKNDDLLRHQEIKIMSKLTDAILKGIDYDAVKKRRRDNYQQLEKVLGEDNLIQLCFSEDCVPMVYPFLTKNSTLKQKLIENKIFVATYWPNVFEWCKPEDWEYQLAEKTIYIPVDQRYCEEDMDRIVKMIRKK